MAKMTDLELTTILDSMELDAVANQDVFITENEELYRRYQAEPYGTEIPGRSSVVCNDVQDIVESDMPSLVRTFLGSNEIFKFIPQTDSPRDIEEAENKTLYVDWLIRKQRDSFHTNHGFLKDICIQKMGVLKYFFEETEKTEEHEYKNLSIEEMLELQESIQTQDGEAEIEIIERGDVNDLGEQDIKFKVTVKRQEIKIIGIPTESFLITQGASSLDDADLVGDTVTKTRGQLLAEGFSKKLVRSLSQTSVVGENNRSSLHQIRFEDEGGFTENQFRQWANEEVEISDLYVMIDFDGDGIAERRHIQKSGDEILTNDPFDHVPYAMASGIAMPHKAIGKSRAEVVAKVAEIKTALTRQMLDNGYIVNNPKMAVNKNVNLDDYLNDAIGGVVRNKGDGNPAANMMPIQIPFVGDKTLMLLQNQDQNKAASVGNQLASQGLNADQLNKETATRFNGVQDASMAKIELVARVVAEIGYRKLYEGVAWMATKFQTTEREFTVLGKAMRSNPSKWKFNHYVEAEIGLGAGDNEKMVENMASIYNVQLQLKAQGSPLVDDQKLYNTLAKLTSNLDVKDVSKHFNNPDEPDELLRAQNEQLNQVVLQLQADNEQLSQRNMLAENEKVKQEGTLLGKQMDNEQKEDQRDEDARQFDITTAQKQSENIDKLASENTKTALKLTELEQKVDKNLNAEVQSNKGVV